MPSTSLIQRLLGVLVLSSITAICLTGCGSKEPATLGQLLKPGQAKGYNILLVTLGNVPQDRLGCYGNLQAMTPTMDLLAADGVQYYNAVTSLPLTLPSHTTIMTGQTPQSHGVLDNDLFALGSEPSTLAEDMHKAGYSTAAFIGSAVLDQRFGLNRGFDFYDLQIKEVTDSTIDWLKQHQSTNPDLPYFAWVHYCDTEITFVDGQLQRLVTWLDESGTRENTVIILTSDHGKSLGEHQEATPGMIDDNSTLKVPLIINCPSRIFGHLAVKNSLVGLVDLRATISEMLGIQPSAPTDGQSLLQPVAAHRSIGLDAENP